MLCNLNRFWLLVTSITLVFTEFNTMPLFYAGYGVGLSLLGDLPQLLLMKYACHTK